MQRSKWGAASAARPGIRAPPGGARHSAGARKLPGGSVDGAAPLICALPTSRSLMRWISTASPSTSSRNAFRDEGPKTLPFAWRSRGEPSSPFQGYRVLCARNISSPVTSEAPPQRSVRRRSLNARDRRCANSFRSGTKDLDLDRAPRRGCRNRHVSAIALGPRTSAVVRFPDSAHARTARASSSVRASARWPLCLLPLGTGRTPAGSPPDRQIAAVSAKSESGEAEPPPPRRLPGEDRS